ncbi:fungal transcriptional regulatory protein [Colletotrichum tofieldiae]|uniref:Fungal transcriptional regulatory protein n=1 Tax=Colletotrichum tofieldiae TaxID=708197 RepID=A0A166QNH7_9PEZI|nr:fungal transcriptional regulatory protein [Colletotrichum tofieldiae]
MENSNYLNLSFLRPFNQESTHSAPSLRPVELHFLTDYAAEGPRWAEQAGREVLPLSDRPSLNVIRALECLTHYFFAHGEMNRAAIYCSLAYEGCTFLNYANRLNGCPSQEAESHAHWMKRRCFWACWGSICASGHPKGYALRIWEEAAYVPLPGSIERHGRRSEDLSCVAVMDTDWKCRPACDYPDCTGKRRSISPMAEMMKMFGIW